MALLKLFQNKHSLNLSLLDITAVRTGNSIPEVPLIGSSLGDVDGLDNFQRRSRLKSLKRCNAARDRQLRLNRLKTLDKVSLPRLCREHT